MINKRLTWFLISNNHISRFQSVFRSDRSTADNLVRLETFIHDAFIKEQQVVPAFNDFEKAYDTAWRYGIVQDIHKLGLRGRLPTFIESFLADPSWLTVWLLWSGGRSPQGGVLSICWWLLYLLSFQKFGDDWTSTTAKFEQDRKWNNMQCL